MRDLDLLQLQRRIDRILSPWSGKESPGCTIGVVRGGALVLHRQAGLANLDLGVPIGPDTTFRVASVTKQFTCAAILLLAAEGKLALSDEIHVHLPELPDFGTPISIDHLMHNTSGIRDFLEVMRLGGMDLHHPCRIDDIVDVLTRQRSLNFRPGSRFLYSNTNFLLLGRIVEGVAREPLAVYTERRIFSPLGMNRTRFVATTAETVPGLAMGYLPRAEGGFVKAEHGFPLGGEGGLVSSVEDLALWDRNFTTHQVGGEFLEAALVAAAPLDGGVPNRYARGLAVTSYRGVLTISHGGLWPGYRTEFLRFPASRLTVICIANLGSIVPYALARAAADAALESERVLHPVPPLPLVGFLRALTGRYFDPDSAATLDIDLKTETTPTVVCNGVAFPLIATKDERLIADASTFELAITPASDGLLVETVPGTPRLFRRAPREAVLPPDLVGSYRCEEAGSTWTIVPTTAGGMRVAAAGPFVSGRAWDVSPVAPDLVRVWTPTQLYQGWFDARVLREVNGSIRALSVAGGRTQGNLFLRLE